MKEKEKMSTFLKEMAFGFFIVTWLLIVDAIQWRIGTIMLILKGTECKLSPRSCLGAFECKDTTSQKENEK